MVTEDISEEYVMNDGEIISVFMDYANHGTITITVRIKRRIKSEKYKTCEVMLLLTNLTEVTISEDFKTNGRYSVFTFQRTGKENYLSFHPYKNAGIPNDQDNFVFRSQNFLFIP